MNEPEPTPTITTSSARVAVAMALVGALAACDATLPNTAPKYVEPPKAAPSAKVRVVNVHPYAYYADIAVFDSPTCFTKANLGMTGGSSADTERIGMLDDKPVSAASLERYVPADSMLVIGPRAVFPTVTNSEIMRSLMPDAQADMRARQAGVCKVPGFVPRLNEQYEVVVDLTPAHCTVTPFHLVGTDGAVRREPVETQPSQISTYEFDMRCFK